MNKHQQSGMTTLLITSMLLIVALLFSLASYKNLFYQIKRTQNEVLARQAHWAAEGGLECGYSKIFIDRDLSKLDSNLYPNYLYDACILKLKLGLDKIKIRPLNGDKIFQLSSKYSSVSHSTVSKIIDLSPKLSSGTIKSTADVFIYGSTTFNPPDPGEEDSGGWECKVARFKRYFVMGGSIVNNGVGSGITSPYIDFNSNGKNCLATHQTKLSSNLLQDFEKDSTIDPFYEFFSVNKINWETVRDSTHYQFGIIDGENVENITESNVFVNRVTDCGNKIATQISLHNKVNIWVNGSCELESTGLTEVVNASQKTENGILIVVHNGVLSINGAGNIKGVLFHFNQPTVFSPEKKDWEGLTAFGILGHGSTVFDTILLNTYPSGSAPLVTNSAYFQNGSFSFSGGQFYDLDGQMALFFNGLDLKYNRDYIKRSMGAGEPQWQQGSWHDF